MVRCRRQDYRTQRDNITYSLLAMDVDRFKSINDSHGHEAGDKVLIALAQALQQGLRDYDCCARWGGDAGLIQSPSQASLPGLSAWVEVGGIASSLCSKALPPPPIST